MKTRGSGLYAVGSVWQSNHCGYFEILRYDSATEITIKFIKTGYIRKVRSGKIKNGKIKDVYYPSVWGVGCLGETSTHMDGSKKLSYRRWGAMMGRCYNPASKILQPTYDNIFVCEDWLCFSIYEGWFDKKSVVGFHVDKDLTVIGCSLYSPQTCSFVPQYINNLINETVNREVGLPTGVSWDSRKEVYRSYCRSYSRYVHLGYFSCPDKAFLSYKKYKEAYIKEVATAAFNSGDINETIYKNLFEWEV